MSGETPNQIATKSVIATSAGYFGLAAATVSTTRFDGGVAFIWVATALLIARLTTLHPSAWAAHLLACGSAGVAVTALFGRKGQIADHRTVTMRVEADRRHLGGMGG